MRRLFKQYYKKLQLCENMSLSDLALHNLCMIELSLSIAIRLLPQVEDDGNFLCIIPVRANEAEVASLELDM